LEDLALFPCEEGPEHAVQDEGADGQHELFTERAVELEGFVRRHVFGEGDEDHPGALWIAEESEGALRLPTQEARRRDVDDDLRDAEHVESVPGRGRVEDDEVVPWLAARWVGVEERLAEHR